MGEHVHQHEPYVDPNLEMLWRVEGGPIKKVELSIMPRWLRGFGYFFISAFLLMLLFGLYATISK
ncbi:MAG: hypothetical protein WCC10_01970 [Tumebacillaceae bacterium]